MSLQDLYMSYDSGPVLTDIHLDLYEGEWLGILGESGSGKSTLLRIIARLIDADRGEVRYRDELLTPVARELIPGHPDIKLIHQDYALFPNQTVTENIGYALRFYDPDYRKQRVEELIVLAGLESVRDKKTKWLSGGEKQRTAIARALAEEPEVLLLDEPFAHLDNHNKQVLSSAIEALRANTQTTCVFVTHESSDALAWSDRIAILQAGKIVQIDRPTVVYQSPYNGYVAGLTGAVNWLGGGAGEPKYIIRPERLSVAQSGDAVRWQGKIMSLRFNGPFWMVRCQNDQGSVTFYHSGNSLSVGDAIQLTYQDEDIIHVH
ncbi:ABC transporter ATP-binding protein [Dyadobacter jejuensis]|nr:ABC transporter ATP-binding protein [Dyadobacter jejuensis]